MAIDVLNERLLTLSAACRVFPRRKRGKRLHVATLYRYTTRGCRGVVLESVQCGASRCTSREAIARFIAQLSGARSQNLPNALPASDVAVEDALRKLGL